MSRYTPNAATAFAERDLGERCCERALRTTLTIDRARGLTEDLTVLAHPIRLRLLDLLSRHGGRVCVCDLESAVPVKQPTVSHHLRILRDAGLVDCHRQGLWAYYLVRRDTLEALRRRVTTAVAGFGLIAGGGR